MTEKSNDILTSTIQEKYGLNKAKSAILNRLFQTAALSARISLENQAKAFPNLKGEKSAIKVLNNMLNFFSEETFAAYLKSMRQKND